MGAVIQNPAWRLLFGSVALGGIAGILLTIDYNIVWSKMYITAAAYIVSTLVYVLMSWYFLRTHNQNS